MRQRILVLLALFANGLHGAEWYAAPDGKPHPSGFGTIDNPWDIATAVGSARLAAPTVIKAGDTIWLRGGDYRTPNLQIRVKGVTIQSYPGEWARLDLHDPAVSHPFIEFLGVGNTYADFEVFSSNPMSRWTPIGTAQRGRFGVYARSKFHRLLLHDLNGIGIGDSNTATGGNEMIGCVSWNHGWVEGRNHGHGMYVQNRGERKLLQACVFFNCFGKGCQVYGSSAAGIENVNFIGCTWFNNGGPGLGRPLDDQDFLYGGDSVIRGAIVERCRVYTQQLNGLLDVGYGFSPFANEDCLVKDCYVTGTIRNLSKFPWPDLVMINNTQVKSPPTKNQIFVESDPTKAGRFIVTVFNWELQPAVTLPLSGDNWSVRSVMQMHEAIATGSGPVVVPMADTIPTKPIGYDRECPAVSRRFNCLIVESGGAVVPPPPPPPPTDEPPPPPPPDDPPPPPPPTAGLTGELVGTTLTIRRDGKRTWQQLYVRQFAISGKYVYFLNTSGNVIRMFENGGSKTVMYREGDAKSFTLDGDGKVIAER